MTDTAPTAPPPPPVIPPPTWQDSAGRTWTLTLTIGQARKLRGTALDILAPETMADILADEGRQLDLLYHLLRDQATAYGLADPAAFDEALTAGPDDFGTALAALLGRLSLFFRSLARVKPAATLAFAAARLAAGDQAPPEPNQPTPGGESTKPPAACS